MALMKSILKNNLKSKKRKKKKKIYKMKKSCFKNKQIQRMI